MNIASLLSNPLQSNLSDPSSTPLAQLPTSEIPGSFAGILATAGLGDQSVSDMINSLGKQDVSPEKLTQTQRDIQKIGEDFEAIFLSMMLKEMRNTSGSEEGGGLFGGEGSDTYGAMFDMFIGQHLAESNQLGIADAVRSYLGNHLNTEDRTAVPGSPIGNNSEEAKTQADRSVSTSAASGSD